MDEIGTEWRFAAGGQVEAAGHGLVDIGWRNGPWSIELFTETLDVRYSHTGARGRAVLGVRGSAVGSNMWLTPWTEGAPDPTRAQRAQALGPDGRLEIWGPRGTWAAVEGSARYHAFTPLADSTLTVPDTAWVRAALALGVWNADGRTLRIAAGVDRTASVAAPFVQGAGSLEAPRGRVVPFANVWAGWAANTDDVVATRLGGLTPYHVPFAGAAWAEFWVEDYVVTRVGTELRLEPFRLCAAVDTGVWTFPSSTSLPDPADRSGGMGLAAGGSWQHNGLFMDAAAGWSPDLARQQGASRWSLFFVLGSHWRGRNGPAPQPARPCAW